MQEYNQFTGFNMSKLKEKLRVGAQVAESKEWKPASEKQMNFVCALYKEGHLTDEDVSLKDGFAFTSSIASMLISKGLEAKNNKPSNQLIFGDSDDGDFTEPF